MPAPESIVDQRQVRPVLGHVNLMIDTFIANANLDDLRTIVRTTLATSPPSVAAAFSAAARDRLTSENAALRPPTSGLFTKQSADGKIKATPELRAVLARARTLYGAGMGLASLGILATVVRATVGLRWEEGADMESSLAAVDADISQALQSSREEIDGGRVSDVSTATAAINELRLAVRESQQDVESWGGPYPFERAAASLGFWKL